MELKQIYEQTQKIEQINGQIAERTQYGERYETPTHKSFKLIWSNRRCWYISYYAEKIGVPVYLDANHILVTGNKKDIEPILPFLNELPLYKNSFEANYR